MKLKQEINDLTAQVMTKITEAAAKHDITTIENLTRVASDLKDVQEKLIHIESRLARLNPEAPNGKPLDVAAELSKLREFKLQITDGAIRQNLLTLTEPLKKGQVKLDEQFTIEAFPSGEKFTTTLLAKGNKLQERGAITRFYKDAHVHGSDYILLTEIALGQWTLRRLPDVDKRAC